MDKSTISILLVEPRKDRSQLIRELFSGKTRGKYELDLAPSYAAALSMVQHRNYDVCFAPSHIGEHDVIDMLSEMLRKEWKIPVIILTSGAESRIDDIDATGRTAYYRLTKDHFSGDFLEQYLRYRLERSRVERLVMRAKKEWEQIFDAVPDPIAIIDRNHQFQRVNRAMADRLGSKPEDLIGRTCYEVVHGLSSPPDFCPMVLMLNDGREHNAEILEENLKGVFLVSVSPYLDDQTNLIGGIHVARDITQLKKIEGALREWNEELEQHVAMRTSELVQKAKDLEESNIALKFLLRHREEDKTEIQESVTHNIKELVFPHLDRMEHGVVTKEQFNASIREIRSTLENVISPFPSFLSGKGLSPAEVRIAEMIRAGKSNKEIADLLSISDGTVRVHRERIRKKLGLTNQKTNLQTYLSGAM
ncbi:MAG: PAS domain-containing protein [Syntrophobacteraceae bacterium]